MTAPESEPGVRVTLRDVWTELRSLADAVHALAALASTSADHERRLRAVERWLYALPISLLMAAGSAAVALWGHHG